ncbi:MAG: hypothetical protein AAF328_04540 [Planctomycetota bacterium]
MPNENFIPSREDQLAIWTGLVYSKLTENPTDFGVTEDQVIPFATAQEAFAAAFALTSDPATKTKITVADKNTKKEAMIAAVRPLIQTIQNSPVMTDAKREELEIPVRDRTPTPVPAPGSAPIIEVTKIDGRTLHLKFKSAEGGRGKAEYAQGLTIFSHVGSEPPADIGTWKFEGSVTTTETKVVFPTSVAPGSQVWLTAFWFNRKAESGPAATPIAAGIGYGGLSQAA